MSAHQPTDLVLKQQSRVLAVAFDDGTAYQLPYEYLRVYSPSAEVKGHGPGQAVLQVGKENVKVVRAEPVGHYAVRLVFDDGHDSGLYSWDYLYKLGLNFEANWHDYLEALTQAGYERKV